MNNKKILAQYNFFFFSYSRNMPNPQQNKMQSEIKNERMKIMKFITI